MNLETTAQRCYSPSVTPNAEQASPDDPLLTAEEVAARCRPPMSANDWRARVGRGGAPEPDEHDDSDSQRSPYRRNPRWRASTVDRFNLVRRPRGRPAEDEPVYVVIPEPGSPGRWVVCHRGTAEVVARANSRIGAQVKLSAIIAAGAEALPQ